MKDFFSKHSYDIIKMFVNQIAISIFGAMLFTATAVAEINGAGSALTIVVSCGAILFYLFLLYTMTWDLGAKDRISVDVGKKQYRPHTGLVLALIANIPNYIIAIAYTIAAPFSAEPGSWAETTVSVVQVVSFFIQGMYRGLIYSISIGQTAIHKFWWIYFIIIIPALVTSWLGYFLGHKNFRLFNFISEKLKNYDKE